MSTGSTLDSYLISAVSGLTIGSVGAILESALALPLLYKHFFGRDRIRLSELSFDEKAIPISGFMFYFWGLLLSLSVIFEWIYRITSSEYTPLTSVSLIDLDRNLLRVRITTLSFFGFAYISLYLFLVCRLYSTFKQSVYEIKSLVIKIYIGILLFSFSISTISMVLIVFGFDRFTMFSVTAAMGFLQFFAIIHLLYSFNRGLFLIVLQQRHSFINEKIKFSDTQKMMMATARKHTLIGVSAILLGLIAIMTIVLAMVIDREPYHPATSYPNSKAYYAVFDGIIACTSNLMSLTLFLGFSVNQTIYTKICSSCDRQCDSLCEKIVLSAFYGNKKHVQIEDDFCV